MSLSQKKPMFLDSYKREHILFLGSQLIVATSYPSTAWYVFVRDRRCVYACVRGVRACVLCVCMCGGVYMHVYTWELVFIYARMCTWNVPKCRRWSHTHTHTHSRALSCQKFFCCFLFLSLSLSHHHSLSLVVTIACTHMYMHVYWHKTMKLRWE